MNKLFALLSSIIIAVAFINGMDKTTDMVLENPINEQSTEIATYYTDFTESNSSLYIPRRISHSNISRPITSKRTNNTYRWFIAYTKANKSTVSYSEIQIHKKYSKSRIAIIKPAHRLISFGKLII
ncbi:MAG: hypothetical protein IKA52_01735 [Bacteroidaceae bacterium]|nr:hypothetical protein [Bacteroidaceae bacterium]